MIQDVLLFGAGYSARRFAATRPEPSIRIAGTTRSASKLEALDRLGIVPFVFDGTSLDDPLRERLTQTEALVISASPEDAGDPVLSVAEEAIAASTALRWIGYLSTVGVYGDHDGDWIDETAACRPTSTRSKRRADAERQWLDLGQRLGVPVAVLRLSGIYGPGRNAFINLRDGTARRLVKPGQVFNRIHVDDIAGGLWHLLDRRLGGIFNVTDDLPAPPQDVVAYAASVMGVEPPPEQAFATAELSPMARSFYGENKRVSNRRLRESGYAFRYTDYRAALDAMWAEANWDGGRAQARSPLR